MLIHIAIYVRITVSAYMHIHMHASMLIQIQIHMSVHMFVHVSAPIFTHMSEHVSYMHSYTHVDPSINIFVFSSAPKSGSRLFDKSPEKAQEVVNMARVSAERNNVYNRPIVKYAAVLHYE